MSLRRDLPTLDVLGSILDAILAFSGAENLAAAGADLEAAIGDLRADAPGLLRAGGVHGRLLTCFDLARQTGMTFDATERLRVTIAGLDAADARSAIVRTYAAAFCCIQEARIVADSAFASRDEVERVMGLLTAAFAASQDALAGLGDAGTYRALVSLRAAAVRDLTARARPLPRLVAYEMPASLSSLVLAQRLFGDSGRADQLVAENAASAVHPLFMPRTGRALSA